MKALIIEDEVMAAKALKKLLGEVSPGIEIVGVLESIEDSVEWIEENPMPDVIFMLQLPSPMINLLKKFFIFVIFKLLAFAADSSIQPFP